MGRQILSVSRLMGIIDELGLYANVRNRVAPEEIVAVMRKDVVVEPLDGTFSAFKISFTASDARVAQAVTGRLTTLFIEEQSKTRGNLAATTTNFLKEQLEAARQRLKLQDENRRTFKTQHLSELPERQSANLGMLIELRSQLQTVATGLSRVQQQRLSLQTSIGENLARLQAERAKLLTHYTPRYPEVVNKDQEIAKVVAVLDRLKTQASGSDSALGAAAEDPALGPLLSQVEANELEAQRLNNEEKRLKAEIQQYQDRLNLTPVREQELAEIVRDYDLHAQDVRELQMKLFQAQQATSVEEQKEGQKFRLLDAPTLPVVPSSPKRLKLSLAGIGAGLAIGFALAFLRESRDRSFHCEQELSQPFPLSLVLSVPLLLTPAEARGRKWKTAFEWVAGSAITLAVVVAEFYVYRSG
jgi:uncharacterized protein involved in exopolysaccharide biosynthesis